MPRRRRCVPRWGASIPEKHVALFDVDETLVSGGPRFDEDERRRYERAILEITGRKPFVVPPRFAGMADPEICRILLIETGLSQELVQTLLPKLITHMGEVYREMSKQLVLNVGVADLLRILARSPTHVIGVLTGNLAAVGREKLMATGIMQFFSEEFYADQYFDRNQLVRDAVDSCKTRYKLFSRRNVVVIGDTPLDISAANSAGATSVGIAGGLYSLNQLRRARAAWVFPNLKPTKQLLGALGLGQMFAT